MVLTSIGMDSMFNDSARPGDKGNIIFRICVSSQNTAIQKEIGYDWTRP